MTKRITTFIVLMACLSTTMAQNLDYRILCGLQQHRTPTMDKVMKGVSNTLVVAPAVPAGMMLYGWAAPNQPTLESGKVVGTSFLATAAATIGLKYAVRRPRPYVAYQDDLVSVTREPDPSFPSGHTSFAFSTAVSLSLQYPKWYVAAPSLLWASAVGFSRLYLGVHYPSDVATGMLIGTISSIVTHKAYQRQQSELGLPKAKISLPPIVLTF